MGTIPFHSQVAGPSGQQFVGADAVNGSVRLGDLFRPMKGVWPAVDATNGPITADSGIVAGGPVTTGLTLYTPASTPAPFNLQSMHLQSYANGVAANSSGSTVWINHNGSRVWWGPSDRAGKPVEGPMDFSFVTDSKVVAVSYFHYAGYSGSAYQDQQWYVEHEGQQKKLTRLPVSASQSGVCHRRVTYLESRQREHRIVLPAQCWLIGVWVEANATIRKAPNRPLLLLNGDSWNEPNGGVIQSPAGGAWGSGGTFRTYYLPDAIREHTGFAVANIAQGGTGYFNCNDGAARAENYADSVGNTVFFGQGRISDAAAKYFARNPILWTVGGWNDGSLGGASPSYQAAYQARVASGIARCKAAKPDLKMMFSTIQPAASSGTVYDDFRYASTLGQIAAAAAEPANVIGVVNQEQMWLNMSTGGQRGANVGPDTLHLTAKGADSVAGWNIAAAAGFVVPRAYLDACLAFDVVNGGAGP